MFNSWKTFITWEKSTQDTIDVKKIYIDMAEDLVSGILLSQIVYWYLPSKEGKSKLRAVKEGHFWIAKKRDEWYDEIRLSEANYKTAVKNLEKRKLIVKDRFKSQFYGGKVITHIRLNIPVFLQRLSELIEEQKAQLDSEILDFENYIQDELDGKKSPEPLGDAETVESTDSETVESTDSEMAESTDSEMVESTDSFTESLEEISTEITSRESIYQNEIQESELPVLIQKVLMSKVDRLILNKINVMDISVLQKTYADLSSGEFANVLVNVLDSEIKKSFKNKLQTSIDKYIENRNKKQSGSQSDKKKNIGLPDFIEEGNTKSITQEDIMTEEQNRKWLEDLLNQMNQDKKEA